MRRHKAGVKAGFLTPLFLPSICKLAAATFEAAAAAALSLEPAAAGAPSSALTSLLIGVRLP